MRRMLILLMMVLGFLICPAMAQEEDSAQDAAPTKEDAAELREARKEAAAYVKEELKRNKKLTSLL